MLALKRLSFLAILAAFVTLATAAYASVDLNYFRGSWIGGQPVQLEWESASELDSAGFNVWRSTTDLPIVNGQIDTSQATQIAGPITDPSTACSNVGRAYEIEDGSVDVAQGTYYYYLESVSCSNAPSAFYGELKQGLPLSVQFLIYLPAVMR